MYFIATNIGGYLVSRDRWTRVFTFQSKFYENYLLFVLRNPDLYFRSFVFYIANVDKFKSTCLLQAYACFIIDEKTSGIGVNIIAETTL